MKIKRYFYGIAVVTIVGFLSSVWLLLQSHADDPNTKLDNTVFLPLVTTGGDAASITAQAIQIAQGASGGGRIDAFTFFIPYAATTMAAQFDAGSTDTDITSDLAIITIISIAVNEDGAVIYYDEWEDTFEADLTLPTQVSTLVWGDGDPTNNNTGLAPGVQVQGIPADDILTAGTIITLRNTVPTVGRGTPPAIYFDGGDTLTSKGSAIAVSTSFWTAEPGPGILYTDAWELYPTNRWGTDYLIPIGENLAGTGLNQRLGFTVVGLNVQAVENDTQVNVDLNNDGTPEQTVTLDQGEQLNMTGGVLVGTRVQATAPVQVQLFASNPTSTYEARGYTMVPFEQWTNDYLVPRSSDGDFWLYNPNGSDLQVSAQTTAGTTTITIPAGQTRRFPSSPAPLLGATGIHFTAPANFYGLAALDANQVQDWGYALLPTANLTSQTLVGLGLGNVDSPGCNSGTGRESRIYVTALTTTTLFVDIDNDGTPDTVDITGDGVADPSPYVLSPLREVSITDPTDCDMTGAFLFTPDGTPFAAAWGQDASASSALPSIDAGTSIVPLRSLALQKTFTLLIDNDCSGGISLGDDVRFQLDYANDSATLLNTVTVSDTLPAALTYIANTTVQNGLPVADNSGPSPYPLDAGGLNTGNLNGFSAGVLTYDATVNNASTIIINRANANTPSLPLQGDAVTIFIPTGTITPLMQISETLIDPISEPISAGQVVTFGLTITNTGTTTITALPLEERFDASHLTFLNAAPAPNITATGVITWSDLTNTLGDLLPNTSISLTISFVVNQLPPAVNNTTLAATVRNALRQNSLVPLTCGGEANLAFAAPTPTPLPPTPTPLPPTPTPTSSEGGGNSTPRPPTLTPVPSATPTPIPVAVVPAATPTVLPVTFLPETGLWETQPSFLWLAGRWLLLVLPGAGVLVFLLRRKSS